MYIVLIIKILKKNTLHTLKKSYNYYAVITSFIFSFHLLNARILMSYKSENVVLQLQITIYRRIRKLI